LPYLPGTVTVNMYNVNIIVQSRRPGMALNKIAVEWFHSPGIPTAKPEYLFPFHQVIKLAECSHMKAAKHLPQIISTFEYGNAEKIPQPQIR
ncbi:MAG: hypothetical protein JNM88_03975, partial [Chitinophagaceae bacterium]|nr:hypothetical protein [Chitinophagaceae bacterium]